ncbi:dihydrodipicolinate synthase family protein [Thermogymnomonas acidicola]|uniref:dihydrodipicolinate synthase family protein n=1 Tax=Thermogymnomonas acidicola TaxID=399579 RepID=UPI001396A33F|nr:dihydrodipicolinate synthase family protein [Thermogymnomonas acidicola]
MRFFERIVSMASRDFAVFQGQDDLLLASLSLGASGGVVGLSNFTTYCTELYSLFREGKYQEARKVQVEKVNRVMQAVNSVTFPIGYYYATYRKLGIDGGGFRQPMYMPDEAARRAIDSVVL